VLEGRCSIAARRCEEEGVGLFGYCPSAAIIFASSQLGSFSMRWKHTLSRLQKFAIAVGRCCG
jgi:hypothetical protein